MPTPAPVVIRAYAKINLDLKIGGLLPDGYHDVRTVLQSVALHDTLTLTAVPGPFTIACDHPAVPTDARNLIWRAASLLQALRSDHANPPKGVHVRLQKRIFAEAGLGGGSSNAAATLVALSRLWDLSLDLPTLSRIAAARGVAADRTTDLAGRDRQAAVWRIDR